MPYVFDFDHKHRRPPMDMKDLLGGKGANLAEMTSVLGCRCRRASPSRPTRAGRTWTAAGPTASIAEVAARAPARAVDGQGLGDPADPLLVSVRSGAKFSMPGMMDTVLNLGLNDQSVRAWPPRPATSGSRYDSYRRFVSMYGRIVLGRRPARGSTTLFDAAKETAGTTSDAKSPPSLARPRRRLQESSQRDTGSAVPPGPRRPAAGGDRGGVPELGTAPGPGPTGSASASPHDLGTAVNVQAMVFGNRDNRSGTGVGFTRDPATGAKGAYGDFLVNAQGEDVVAGIRNTEPLSALQGPVSRRSTASCSTSSTAWSVTTGTCATPSSPSSRASSGCCRRGWASAPGGPPCGWPSR